MSENRSKKLSYKFDSLELNDGTHELSNDHFHSVQPSFAGDLKYSVRTNDHRGWLKCDGRSLNREDHPDLFEAIGTSFGSINGNSFNLPDCRGRVLGAIGQGTGLTNRNLGSAVGTETHTLTIAQMPSHTHTSNAVGGSLGLMSANGNNTAGDGLDFTSGEPNLYAAPAALTINSNGSGEAHNIMQPTIFISNVFIFSK